MVSFPSMREVLPQDVTSVLTIQWVALRFPAQLRSLRKRPITPNASAIGRGRLAVIWLDPHWTLTDCCSVHATLLCAPDPMTQPRNQVINKMNYQITRCGSAIEHRSVMTSARSLSRVRQAIKLSNNSNDEDIKHLSEEMVGFDLPLPAWHHGSIHRQWISSPYLMTNISNAIQF